MSRSLSKHSKFITGSKVGNPATLAVDGRGNLYVGDAGASISTSYYPGNRRVTMRTPQGGWDVLIDTSRHPGLFSSPFALAVDVRGTLYLEDEEKHNLLMRSTEGAWSVLATNRTAPSYHFSPAVDSLGRLYIIDPEKEEILRYTPPARPILNGDPNFDGKVTLDDVILILQSLVGLRDGLLPDQVTAADVVKDETVDLNDVVKILRVMAGADPGF